MAASLERDLEEFVSGIGFELVSMERGGGRRRPLLRLRVDRPDSRPGHSSVSVGDCAEVSRAVSQFLEERASGEDEWVLEVSSPGVERPLHKRRDFERFKGEQVAVKGTEVLLSGSHRVEGELLGLQEKEGEPEAVCLRLSDGEEVAIPRSKIRKAHLVFTWK